MTTQQAENLIEIRASSLPTAMDCPRMWAAKMALDPRSNFMPIMQKHGFMLSKKKGKNVGAQIGQACHDAFGTYFQAKIDGYNVDPIPLALASYRKKIEEGSVEYDGAKSGVTKDPETALIQVERMVQEYLPTAQTLKPKRVEFKLVLRVDPLKPYLASGTPDDYEENFDINDMKFGRNLSPYEAQLGLYRLMARSMGMPTGKLFLHHTPRCTIKKPQKPTEIIPYDVSVAENAAHYTLEESVTRIDKFIETGNPYAFPPNPNSNLCSKKWCPAWGTSFCDMGRPEKPSAETEE